MLPNEIAIFIQTTLKTLDRKLEDIKFRSFCIAIWACCSRQKHGVGVVVTRRLSTQSFSWVDDPESFYNISLTCQRFSQVCKIMKSELHRNLLRKKAEYFIECYIDTVSDIANSYSDFIDCKCRLKDLLRSCMHLAAAKRFLSYDKVLDVWQRNGPVAAKLFTWVRKYESFVRDEEPRSPPADPDKFTKFKLRQQHEDRVFILQ